MLRKLGTVTAVLVAVLGSAAPASAGTSLPRTATSTEVVTGYGVVYALTGEAVEADVTVGSTTGFTASCEVTLVVTGWSVPPPIGLWPMDAVCWVEDVTTGQQHHLTPLVSTGDFATAAGIVTGPADHDYQLCVGAFVYYPNGEPGGPLESPCKALQRGV